MEISSTILGFELSLQLAPCPFLCNFQKDDGDVVSPASAIGLVDENLRFPFEGNGKVVQNRLDGGLRNIVCKAVGAHEKKVPRLRADRAEEHVDLWSQPEHPGQNILDQGI